MTNDYETLSKILVSMGAVIDECSPEHIRFTFNNQDISIYPDSWSEEECSVGVRVNQLIYYS